MQITIINDCCDQNAKLRQTARAGSLFGNCSVNCFGAKSELEAAGFIVDALDAFEERSGIILANVAPRGGNAKKWSNGTPFGFFRYKNALVLSSVDGRILSLAKKLGIINQLFVLDIKNVLDSIDTNKLGAETKERIINSQFRSFDFLPRAAYWLNKKINIPHEKYDASEIPNISPSIWFIDNFGNIKTTLLKEDLVIVNNNDVKLKIGKKIKKMNFYNRLKDVPDKKIGLVFGSSGIEEKRFVEIVAQRDSAAKKLEAKEGDDIAIA